MNKEFIHCLMLIAELDGARKLQEFTMEMGHRDDFSEKLSERRRIKMSKIKEDLAMLLPKLSEEEQNFLDEIIDEKIGHSFNNQTVN